jgi:hypothetical protein
MTIQKFPLDKIKKVRQYIHTALTQSDPQLSAQSWQDETAEIPEPESIDDLSGIFAFGGVPQAELSPVSQRIQWTLSTVNPGAALLKLPGLSVKPYYRLVCYSYHAESSGVGVIWAVPEALSTTALLESAIAPDCDRTHPPKPEGALSHFMEAIVGDRTPVSFVIASILRRELQEFGAVGESQSWSHHHLVDAVPDKVNWQWRTEPAKDLLPKVKVGADGAALVEFFSCRTKKPIALYRHVDQYPANQYKANSLDKAIATM